MADEIVCIRLGLEVAHQHGRLHAVGGHWKQVQIIDESDGCVHGLSTIERVTDIGTFTTCLTGLKRATAPHQ